MLDHMRKLLAALLSISVQGFDAKSISIFAALSRSIDANYCQLLARMGESVTHFLPCS